MALEYAVEQAHGRFTFRPPVVYATNLVARASLESDGRHLWGEVTSPSNPIGKDNVLVMDPMWRISGNVTVDGRPMKDVRVMVWRNSPGLSLVGNHSMNGNGKRVDANGYYEWFVPPNGKYHVVMWDFPFKGNPQGHYSVRKVGENELLAEEIQFTFAEGVISGRVTLADGTPVSEIRVHPIPKFRDGNRMLLANPSQNTRRTVTGKDGVFTSEGLPEGEYQITASSVARPKTFSSATAHTRVGDRDVRIVVTPVSASTGTNASSISSSRWLGALSVGYRMPKENPQWESPGDIALSWRRRIPSRLGSLVGRMEEALRRTSGKPCNPGASLRSIRRLRTTFGFQRDPTFVLRCEAALFQRLQDFPKSYCWHSRSCKLSVPSTLKNS